MPDFPEIMASQVLGTSKPTGLTTPSPVQLSGVFGLSYYSNVMRFPVYMLLYLIYHTNSVHTTLRLILTRELMFYILVINRINTVPVGCYKILPCYVLGDSDKISNGDYPKCLLIPLSLRVHANIT